MKPCCIFCCGICGSICENEFTYFEAICKNCGADKADQTMIICSLCSMPMRQSDLSDEFIIWEHCSSVDCDCDDIIPALMMKTVLPDGHIVSVTRRRCLVSSFTGNIRYRERYDSRYFSEYEDSKLNYKRYK